MVFESRRTRLDLGLVRLDSCGRDYLLSAFTTSTAGPESDPVFLGSGFDVFYVGKSRVIVGMNLVRKRAARSLPVQTIQSVTIGLDQQMRVKKHQQQTKPALNSDQQKQRQSSTRETDFAIDQTQDAQRASVQTPKHQRYA